MSAEQLVRNCAPTLAGIKTGNLYTLQGINRQKVARELHLLDMTMRRKGVRIRPLILEEDRTLIYMYRPSMLRKDLSDPRAGRLLRSLGYSLTSVESSISELRKKIRSEGAFPHEIGLFLGYPPDDVIGFIRNPREGYLLSGYWKVYSDAQKAEETFRRFRKCTEEYERMFRSGRTLEQLVV